MYDTTSTPTSSRKLTDIEFMTWGRIYKISYYLSQDYRKIDRKSVVSSPVMMILRTSNRHKDRQYKIETETDKIKTRLKKRIIPHKKLTKTLYCMIYLTSIITMSQNSLMIIPYTTADGPIKKVKNCVKLTIYHKFIQINGGH